MLVASNTLLITDLSPEDMSTDSINTLTATLNSFGKLRYLVPFKALNRLVVVYSSTTEAIAAKDGLLNNTVYFGQETELESQVDYLKVPEIEKNFLLSPPGSPPVDWIQGKETNPAKGGHSQIWDDMDDLTLDNYSRPVTSSEDQMNCSSGNGRIVLNFNNPLPCLTNQSSESSLPMIVVDNYDGEDLNQQDWMGGGSLKSKKGAVFHQTRMPDYN